MSKVLISNKRDISLDEDGDIVIVETKTTIIPKAEAIENLIDNKIRKPDKGLLLNIKTKISGLFKGLTEEDEEQKTSNLLKNPDHFKLLLQKNKSNSKGIKKCKHREGNVYKLHNDKEKIHCDLCNESYNLIIGDDDKIREIIREGGYEVLRDLLYSITTFYYDIPEEDLEYISNIDLDNITNEDRLKFILLYRMGYSNFLINKDKRLDCFINNKLE